MATQSRRDRAAMYGPTVGDRVRLADTELWISPERDLTVGRDNAPRYGEEVKFGGGKVIRDGMGQSQRARSEGAVDTVITNALILDWSGVVKADVGLRDGRIHKIGKAGNPDTQPGVDVVVGPGTEVIAGENRILTAGGIDSHIHFICPQQVDDALHSGMTTMIGGGAGLHEPHAALHGQHGGRAPRHAHGLPPPRPLHPRGRGLRREPHPSRDHRCRGHPA